MVPLLGHSAGHCGIAIKQQNQWLLFCGDAYYSHLELNPKNKLRSLTLLEKTFAEDNEKRLVNLKKYSIWLNMSQRLKLFVPMILMSFDGIKHEKTLPHCFCSVFKPTRMYAT